MTPTRIEFELLRNQVEFLSNSFDWVVGGIGIVITFVIILVGYFVTQSNSRELQVIKNEAKAQTKEMVDVTFNQLQQKIDDTYRNLEELIQDRVKEVVDKMYEHVDGKHSETESIIYNFKSLAEGELARIFALANEDKGYWAQSFGWWLSAATNYHDADENELKKLSLNEAKGMLEKIEKFDAVNIDTLWEKMDKNKDILTKLKVTNSIAEVIEVLMLEKAKLEKEKTPTV